MSVLSCLILGACLGSVISVFAMVAGIVADDKVARGKAEEATAEAYKSGLIAGSRWKEAEKAMLEEAMAELREYFHELERRQA